MGRKIKLSPELEKKMREADQTREAFERWFAKLLRAANRCTKLRAKLKRLSAQIRNLEQPAPEKAVSP